MVFMGTCPFRKGYERLKALNMLATEHGVDQSVKHASHKNMYPGSDVSRSLFMMMRKELQETFVGVDVYIQQVLQDQPIDDLLHEYEALVLEHQMDTDLLLIPQEKGYDTVKQRLIQEFGDNAIIQNFLQAYVVHTQLNGEQSCKQVVTHIMKELAQYMNKGHSFLEAIATLSGTTTLDPDTAIDPNTKEGLILFASLQERHYHTSDIQTRNNHVSQDSAYVRLIKLTHILLHKYIQRYCQQHTERLDHSFHVFQEISLHPAQKKIIPNQRFLKVLASNIGPGLLASQELSFDKKLNAIRKELQIYNQYIFGFIKKCNTIVVDAIEIKACPAQQVIHSTLQQVQQALTKDDSLIGV